tara:strand:- start:961 stop:1440 length:480 start_codon:yes stop_codon:yes gene_type:complete
MNEPKLRETIRKEIRKSLKEVDITKGVEQGTAQIDKQPGIKMLKRALGQGSPRQQAAGLLKVINSISGGNAAVKNMLIQMLKPKDALGSETPDQPVAEGPLDQLQKKQSKVDNYSVMKQLRNNLSQKSVQVQAQFISDLVKSLNFKGNINQLIRKIREA